MRPIQVPAPKLEDVISENEYVITWNYCQLKVEDELKDFQCEENEGFPNCTTCSYQIKINEEIQRSYEECMKQNKKMQNSTEEATGEVSG